MSRRAMDEAYSERMLADTRLRPIHHAVVRALAWHLNEKTGQCNPGIVTLCGTAGGWSQAGVRAALKDLRDWGLVKPCTRQKANGRGRASNSYDLLFLRHDLSPGAGAKTHAQAPPGSGPSATSWHDQAPHAGGPNSEQGRGNREENRESRSRGGRAGAREAPARVRSGFSSPGKQATDHEPLVEDVCGLLVRGIDGEPDQEACPRPIPGSAQRAEIEGFLARHQHRPGHRATALAAADGARRYIQGSWAPVANPAGLYAKKYRDLSGEPPQTRQPRQRRASRPQPVGAALGRLTRDLAPEPPVRAQP